MTTIVDLDHTASCRRLGCSVSESRAAVVVQCHSCQATITVRLGAPEPDPPRTCRQCGQRRPLARDMLCADCYCHQDHGLGAGQS